MTISSPPTLSDLPVAPDKSAQGTFNARVVAMFDALKNTAIGEWRSMLSWIASAAADAATSASNAASSAVNSAASASSAASSLAAAQAVSGASRWVAGSYGPGVVVWSPANGQNYRSRFSIASSTTDPANDPGKWFPLLLLQALPVITVSSSGAVVCSANVHYVVTGTGVNLKMPASPNPGDLFGITNASGVTTNTLDPNGKTLQGDASVMALDDLTGSCTLKFTTSQGWIKQ